jgi:hypothetical protein
LVSSVIHILQNLKGLLEGGASITRLARLGGH